MFSDKGGYYVFPNGLILQWGEVPIDDSQYVIYSECNLFTIQFPKKFPNKILSLNITLHMNGAEEEGNVSPYVISKNNTSAYGIVDLGYWASEERLYETFKATIWYIAIGY